MVKQCVCVRSKDAPQLRVDIIMQHLRDMAKSSTTLDENLSRIRVHRNSIHRYRRLLGTKLTDVERTFIERRLSEEQRALNSAVAETFPVTFPLVAPRVMTG